MASPPAKRQRRTVAVTSEEDNEESAAESQQSSTSLNITTRSLSIKNESKSKSKLSTTDQAQTSTKPKKGRAKTTAKKEDKVTKNASLYSFFSNSPPGSTSKPRKRKSAERESTALEFDDAIEDIPDDELSSTQTDARSQRSRNTKHRGKYGGGSDEQSQATVVSRSKQFATAVVTSDSSEGDLKSSSSWADLYPPESLDELVVHKRKVADVHKWLDNVVEGREKKRLLVLKGPSGSGKTATLRLLATELGCQLIEWENPVGSAFEDAGFVSLAAQFDEFLTRTLNFQSLDLVDPGVERNTKTKSNDLESNMIVLVEDFPNTFSRGSSALLNFRDSILRFLAASTPVSGVRASDIKVTPVVMIVSETHLSSSTEYQDSFTVNKLLGQQLLQHPSLTVIEFNTVAPTLLFKALSTVLRKENRKRGKRFTPNADLLKQISQSGDIRNAVNALQLASLFDSTYASSMLPAILKSSKKRTSATHSPSSSSLSFRSEQVDLFHAAGKILYNKRTEPRESQDLTQPPAHLRHYFRPRESEISLSELYSSISTDIDTFISTLQENYPPSCYGEDFADSVDDCITDLSDADLLLSASTDGAASRMSGRAPASIIQADYAFHLSAQGLLFSLPYPVDRGKTLSALLKLGRDPFKMVYPAGLRLWRQIDENETIIEAWSTYLFDSANDLGVCKRLSSTVMSCEVIPIIDRIMPDLTFAGQPGKGKSRIQEDNEDGDENLVMLGSTLTMPLPPSGFNIWQSKPGINFGGQGILPAKDEKLILSDDDIEDD